jgi:uncharacterized protein (TIGR02265 family)
MDSDAGETGSAPYDWDKDLEQRLSLARPGDTVRGLFSNGIVKTVRSLGGEAAVTRCFEACGERKFVDFFNYPVRTHLLLVFTAAKLLAPRYGGIEQALRQLGRNSTADFLGSAAGRTMKLIAGGSPMKLMDTLPLAYQVSLSFGTQTLEWTGSTSGRYTLQRDFIPLPSHEGVLAALLETGGAQDVKVHGRRTSGLLDSTYAFSWS